MLFERFGALQGNKLLGPVQAMEWAITSAELSMATLPVSYCKTVVLSFLTSITTVTYGQLTVGCHIVHPCAKERMKSSNMMPERETGR